VPSRLSWVLLAPFVLVGCYSFGVKRHTIELRSGRESAQVHVWTQQEGTFAETPFGAGCLYSLLTYPFNVVSGLAYGVCAPFDGERDVLHGPIGWVAGTFVPGCTLNGPIKELSPRDLELAPESHASLLAALRRGDEGGTAFRAATLEVWPWQHLCVLDAALAPTPEP
jgi:hypothetical protein